MPGRTEALAICRGVLRSINLDEDTLQYIANGVVDDDALLEESDLIEFVQPLVEEAVDGDEEKAEEMAGCLHAALSRLFATTEAAAEQSPTLAGVTMGSLAAQVDLEVYKPPSTLKEERANYKLHGVAVEANIATMKAAEAPANTDPSGAAAKELKKMQQKSETAALAAKALDAEIQAASERATRERGAKGHNLKSAIKLGPFDLPHPSGHGNLLDNASFTLTPGRRYALIGRNGKGKSTLMRNLAARRVGGIHPSVRVHYVSQDVHFSEDAMEQTPVEVITAADVERKVLEERAEELQGTTKPEEVEELSNVLSHLKAIDAESVAARARELLKNLGFTSELMKRKMRELSGGWRVRVALAAAVFAKPDILFLDEPTNHLSMQAVLWLRSELSAGATWQSRIVVVVSHDKFFIDETCTDMLHISGVARRLTQTQAKYSTWAQFRDEQQRAYERSAKHRQETIAKHKAYNASGAAACGGGANRWSQIDKLEREATAEAEEMLALQEDRDFPLELLSAGTLDNTAIHLQNMSFSYPQGKSIFSGIGRPPHELIIGTKSRIVFMGENGNGKTTLMKLLLGELKPTSGEVVINRHARLAVVNQHHADQLDLSMSPFQIIKSKVPGNGSDTWIKFLRDDLISNGLPAGLLDVPALALSGGQRSRLAMCAVSAVRPHILFMDEPTNNLDVAGVEALVDAVKKFDGGVVLVSHDQYFVSQVAEEVWVVEDNEVKPCACGFEEYWAKMLARVDPGSPLAIDAIEVYRRKKMVSPAFMSGGQAAQQALAKELAGLKGTS